VGRTLGKLEKMEDSERERRELERQSRSTTTHQRRREANLVRIKAMMRDPKLEDPQVREAGIERAREALRMASATRGQDCA
jgi:hypothetical protein